MTRIALTLAAALSALAAALPGQARASLPLDPAQVSCQDWEDGRPAIVVTAPKMNPLVPYGLVVGPDGSINTNPSQWVAFRVTLYRVVGSSYVFDVQTPWMAIDADSNTDSSSRDWLNLDTNRWEDGVWIFGINRKGIYKVWVNYYWYADRSFGSASAAAFAPTNGTIVPGACTF